MGVFWKTLFSSQAVHVIGPWTFRYQCHCGYVPWDGSKRTICPECGCDDVDAFKSHIGRYEWDRKGNYYDRYNEVWVEKPEGCQAKEKQHD
jgi:hypothetical protein